MQCAVQCSLRSGASSVRRPVSRQPCLPLRPISITAARLSRRQEQSWVVASTGGGSGGSGAAGGGSGGGGGGDGDDGQQKKTGGIMWKGWQDRVAADPQFVYKVVIEQVIGVTASVIGDMAGRPNWGLKELDFVFATLVVGSIVNFALMYLLAPTASAAAAGAPQGLIARLLSEQTLTAMGAPGGHMFQPGYGLGGRLINFAYKGAIFATIGMMAGLVGTSISNGLLAVRKKMDPDFKGNEPPSVVGNAACWALHMGLSSNLRYQMLNGMDMVIQPVIPSSVFRVFSAAIRGVNNAVGGVSFVMIARGLGVQKASNDKKAEPAEPADKKGKKKSK